MYAEMKEKGWTTDPLFVGYRAAAQARADRVKNILANLRFGQEEGKDGKFNKIGQVNDKWCQDKIGELFKDYLIGEKGVKEILDAGTFHEAEKVDGDYWFKALKPFVPREK